MRLGSIELIALSDGTFGLDGGSMFGIVPRPLWAREATPDARNRITCALNLLLVKDGDRNILIDCGIGDRWDHKQADRYAISKATGSLDSTLAQHGMRSEDITDVIVSHMHFDHQGGAVVRDQSGALVPRFPNAVYHYQKRQVDWARNPVAVDTASFRPDDFFPVFDAGQAEMHEGNWHMNNHITVEVLDGHTTGLQVVHIATESGHVAFCSDSIPLSPHIKLPYIMAYDLRPVKSLQEKADLLERAADGGWHLFLMHDPQWVAVKVEQGVREFTISEKIDAVTWNAS